MEKIVIPGVNTMPERIALARKKMMEFTPPTLTREQWEALADCLSEEAMRRDDDGNEGAFAASPLGPVYKAIQKALR